MRGIVWLMVDALEATLAWLLLDDSLRLLTGGRIAVQHKFGDGWAVPSRALQIRYDGGTPDLYTPRQVVRLEARCYGENSYEASKVYRALIARTRETLRERVQTTDGFALLYWLVALSGPNMLRDPEAEVDMILIFVETCVSETDIP